MATSPIPNSETNGTSASKGRSTGTGIVATPSAGAYGASWLPR
jgi:hypothetical protein